MQEAIWGGSCGMWRCQVRAFMLVPGLFRRFSERSFGAGFLAWAFGRCGPIHCLAPVPGAFSTPLPQVQDGISLP